MMRDLDSDVDNRQMTHSLGDGCDPPHTLPDVEPDADNDFDTAILLAAKAIAEREGAWGADLARALGLLADRIAARQDVGCYMPAQPRREPELDDDSLRDGGLRTSAGEREMP